MMQVLNENNFSRLAKAIIEKRRCTYEEAQHILGQLHLNLICDDGIASSTSLQAALLTAVNTGKRAFHGGVNVVMPTAVACRVPWPEKRTLNEIVLALGGNFGEITHSADSQTLYFGNPHDPIPDGLTIHCTGWRGGVAPAENSFSIASGCEFALGGILAAALGVAKGFLRVSGSSSRFVEEPCGISLWRPDLNWDAPEAEGPRIEILPRRLWLLGLGHLGQAFLWNLGLLPYRNPGEVTVMLQDYDHVVEGNNTSGLLCEEGSVGKYKTRICANWLEMRGFQTMITERPFDATTKRTGEEPFVALCGFDSPDARQLIESAGFDLVVECGLGATADLFDNILFHTFPDARQTARATWTKPTAEIDPSTREMFLEIFKSEQDCGIIAETLAGKAVSSSFVGAFAGAVVIGELLRGLHGGKRCEFMNLHLRSSDPPAVVYKEEICGNRLARNGFSAVLTNAASRGNGL